MAILSILAQHTKKSMNYIKSQKGLLIIGNGFDRDLQRKITYEEFYNSEFWPHGKISECPLSKFLEEELPKDYWYNLEDALSYYVDANNNDHEYWKVEDLTFYAQLVEGMKQYANSKNIQSLSSIKQYKGRLHKQVPLAYQVLETVILNPLYRIFSFNYTELHSIEQLILENNRTDRPIQKRINRLENILEYVHGSLDTKDIILGAKDCQTIKGYEIIRKTQQLKVNHLVAELETANQVVIFGHSLSAIDRCYFDDFFMQIKNKESHCRSVIIFTYNENSMLEIKRNLKQFYNLDWKCPVIEYYTTIDYQK